MKNYLVILGMGVMGLLSLNLAACTDGYHQESTGQYLDSSAVTLKVKARLIDDPMVKSFPITVKTYKGTVQLSGFVHNRAQANRAAALAASVPGVSQVENDLIIK